LIPEKACRCRSVPGLFDSVPKGEEPYAVHAVDLSRREAGRQNAGSSGHFRAGSQLQPTSNATTIREKNGKAVTIDGPFAETKEQLGGYYLVECKDLDEAIALAKRIPLVANGGVVEVRPLVPTSQAAATPSAR
jgi:hypothetical protein